MMRYRDGYCTFGVLCSVLEFRILSRSSRIILAHQKQRWPASPVHPERHQLQQRDEALPVIRYIDRHSEGEPADMTSDMIVAYADLAEVAGSKIPRDYAVIIADARIDPTAPRASQLSVMLQTRIVEFVRRCIDHQDAPTRIGLLVKLVEECTAL